MITVIVTPREHEELSASLLPPTQTYPGFDRVYRIYRSDAPCLFEDPANGSLLVEGHVFADLDEAHRWVEMDDEQRRLLHESRGVQA